MPPNADADGPPQPPPPLPPPPGLAAGFADLASLVRAAVVTDRTVLDTLPFRDGAVVPAGGVVGGDALDRVFDATARGVLAGPPSPHRASPRPRREGAGKGLAVVAAINVALLWAGANAPTEPR